MKQSAASTPQAGSSSSVTPTKHKPRVSKRVIVLAIITFVVILFSGLFLFYFVIFSTVRGNDPTVRFLTDTIQKGQSTSVLYSNNASNQDAVFQAKVTAAQRAAAVGRYVTKPVPLTKDMAIKNQSMRFDGGQGNGAQVYKMCKQDSSSDCLYFYIHRFGRFVYDFEYSTSQDTAMGYFLQAISEQ